MESSPKLMVKGLIQDDTILDGILRLILLIDKLSSSRPLYLFSLVRSRWFQKNFNYSFDCGMSSTQSNRLA